MPAAAAASFFLFLTSFFVLERALIVNANTHCGRQVCATVNDEKNVRYKKDLKELAAGAVAAAALTLLYNLLCVAFPIKTSNQKKHDTFSLYIYIYILQDCVILYNSECEVKSV
jgi:capsule polysaccharide modification protein KpsS